MTWKADIVKKVENCTTGVGRTKMICQLMTDEQFEEWLEEENTITFVEDYCDETPEDTKDLEHQLNLVSDEAHDAFYTLFGGNLDKGESNNGETDSQESKSPEGPKNPANETVSRQKTNTKPSETKKDIVNKQPTIAPDKQDVKKAKTGKPTDEQVAEAKKTKEMCTVLYNLLNETGHDVLDASNEVDKNLKTGKS